jgi:hypothetical protein
VKTWFPLTYDSVTKIITAAFCAALLILAMVTHLVAIGAVAAIIAILGFAWSPRGYWVSDRAITVKRLIGNVVIPLEALREIRRAGADDFTGCIRLFGSGGLFGYYGIFRTSKLGKSTWYLTNRRNAVVAIGPKTVLFSPDNPDGFVDAVRSVAAHVESGSPGELTTQRDSGFRSKAWIALAMAAGSIALVCTILWYKPGPVKYVLADRKLAIQDRFYPITLGAADVDIANARLIDATKDPDWRVTLRVNGIATQHYRAGWFRVARGQNVLMYSIGARHLVLIPARGNATTVLMEVPDPEAFLERLRRELN